MSYKLTRSGLYIQRQVPIPIIYKEVKLECGYRIDTLVEDRIVLEYKSAPFCRFALHKC